MTRKNTRRRTPAKPQKNPVAKPKAAKKAVKRPAGARTVSRQNFVEPVMTERLPGIALGSAIEPVAAPASPAVPKTETTTSPTAVTGEELYKCIQFEAYLLGERDGFKADPVHYWIQAERAVKKALRS